MSFENSIDSRVPESIKYFVISGPNAPGWVTALEKNFRFYRKSSQNSENSAILSHLDPFSDEFAQEDDFTIEEDLAQMIAEIEDIKEQDMVNQADIIGLQNELENLKHSLQENIEKLRMVFQQDMAELKEEVYGKIDNLREELRLDVVNFKTVVMKWVVGLMTISTVAITFALKI